MEGGGDLLIDVAVPRSVSARDRSEFTRLVLEGGKVSAATLPKLIDCALYLAFGRIEGAVSGIGALKRPYDRHRETVFSQAKSSLPGSLFPYELGWLFVVEAARNRGIARRLVSALLARVDGFVYATSDVTNKAMHRILLTEGFTPEGLPYPSALDAPDIQLFLKRTVSSTGIQAFATPKNE